MTGQLDVSREEHLGIIALNRPEAINALSADMLQGIRRTLRDWAEDDGIRVVLFEGRGPRGFCSGGDVRAIREVVLAGHAELADRYFALEYAMNEQIANFPKPTVALSHGVVMGGGIGIAGHCRYRFTSPDSRWAMPEALIGFVSDVGVNHILGKAPLHRALLFLLSGVAVGPADALALGLVDCVYDPARREAMLTAFAAAAASTKPDVALTHLVQAEMAPTGDAGFSALADRHAGLAWTTPGGITSALPDYPEVDQMLEGGSPTSHAFIHESHLAARRMATIGEVLAQDLRLAQLFCRHADFVEGVRAVLVDKDRQARWAPADYAFIEKAAAAIGPKPV